MIGGSPGVCIPGTASNAMRIAEYDMYGMEFVKWAIEMYSPAWRPAAYHLTILSPCRRRCRYLRTYSPKHAKAKEGARHEKLRKAARTCARSNVEASLEGPWLLEVEFDDMLR